MSGGRAWAVVAIALAIGWVASNPPLARAAEGTSETLPEGLAIASLEAFPERIELNRPLAYRQLLVLGRLETGELADLTRQATLTTTPEHVAVSPSGLVTPLTEGEETLKFTCQGRTIEVPVRVQGLDQAPPTSFLRDVQPALSRMSCNAGTCHGSKDGKNGFKLSLRGYDPQYDHDALTDDIGARRFNRAAPDQSLMLLKATGSIPHVGGVRTRVGEPYYQLIERWIREGARLDLDSPRVASIEVRPSNPVLPRAEMRLQISVLATYTDGSVRDVTREAFVESGNIEVVESETGGIIRTLRRGEAPVLVRYEGAYAATTLTVMGDRSGFEWQATEGLGPIDQLVYDKLRRTKILPAELCSDEEFVRRVYLDLTGLPPTADDVRRFLEDARPSTERRDALVDELIGSGPFVEHWTNKWADLLQVNRKFLGEEGSLALRNWIKQAVAGNLPYDEFARQILTGSGSSLENPPAAYYKILREAPERMENTTHLFLAIRFNCNKCHDHPFERWTQDQYYGLAAYFAQVGLKEDPAHAGEKIGGSAVEGAKPLVEIVFDQGSGEINHDRTGQVSAPAFPYTHEDLAPTSASRREQLAHWITSQSNPYFARSFVNRLWGYLLGVGIIEPIDDIRAGNPPTNPELLDLLTREFVDSGFDMQHMLRMICKSRTYQHSVQSNRWNEDDRINYSHALPRRLPAEVLFDAIHATLGSTPRLPGVPAGFRAAELPDAGIVVPFLDDFGRPVRESSCECERSSGMVLGPVLKLINGPTVADAIADPNGDVSRLAREIADDRQLIDELFLRILSRHATAGEIEVGLEAIRTATEDHQTLVDQLRAREAAVDATQEEWERSFSGATTWTPVELVELRSQVGAEFQRQDDGSVLVVGEPQKDVYTVVARSSLPRLTALRLEALADPKLPASGPGRAQNGNFVLSELTLTVTAPNKEPRRVPLRNAQADFSQESWPAPNAIDGNEGTGWAVSPKFGVNHTWTAEVAEEVLLEEGAQVTLTMSQQFPDGKHLLGRFRVSLSDTPGPVRTEGPPADLAALLNTPRDQRTPEQAADLQRRHRAEDGELNALEQQVAASAERVKNPRLVGMQDLAWALINSPAFLFNR